MTSIWFILAAILAGGTVAGLFFFFNKTRESEPDMEPDIGPSENDANEAGEGSDGSSTGGDGGSD